MFDLNDMPGIYIRLFKICNMLVFYAKPKSYQIYEVGFLFKAIFLPNLRNVGFLKKTKFRKFVINLYYGNLRNVRKICMRWIRFVKLATCFTPHIQPTTLLHPTPQATSWHQNRSHYHCGTAESSFTGKKWFGHSAGRSPFAQSIGKFFLCYTFFFFWNFCPRLGRELLVDMYVCWISGDSLFVPPDFPAPNGVM